ncbi:pseudouridylate synthase 7 homolog isoform X2 [Zingiber officinale]|uniref:pseudouridylate synthase 7 homolog isoform X1 n=1 Tax=Zingiber officinale TaxID=94328 RepID=UPI001C4AF6AB|nr:pseudouridylate synthase 7 homolog isoform X1 [Zingiber officinale]XP_042392802.1 pseudouridylate synthase 7 homolog isoform X2 [Zingiber officinale]
MLPQSGAQNSRHAGSRGRIHCMRSYPAFCKRLFQGYHLQAAGIKVGELNSIMFGVKLGDFCYVNEGLILGQLTGNYFTITLRGITADSEDIIKEATDTLRRNGFINYYGLNR